MKILVFTDIHGGYNALKALTTTDDFKTSDKVIFLGDVVFGASRPNECIELLTKYNIDCIVGNNDAYIFDHIPEADKCTFSQGKLKQLQWMSQHITQQNKDIMSRWPKSMTLTINNKKFYFTHYVWEFFNNDYNVIDTDEVPTLENREKMFLGIEADYYIYGHEHRSHYFKNADKHYACLPSVGLHSPAQYLIIESNNEDIKLVNKSVEFDINEEIDLIEKLDTLTMNKNLDNNKNTSVVFF